MVRLGLPDNFYSLLNVRFSMPFLRFQQRLCGLIVTVLTCGMVVPNGSCFVVSAQEIRVYTTVRDLAAIGPQDPADRAPVLARSLTLFHAGRIYDYVDSAKEVTVYEPSHQRFHLLSEARSSRTEVTQSEVRRFLTLVEEEAWKRADESDVTWLKFQLKPEFESSFDRPKLKLSLVGRNCRYDVEGVTPKTREVTETYLRFADAMAELNSVLHPRAMLPSPRLKLNEELRQRELLPLVVELRAELDRPLNLQARHQWEWKFSSSDRELISKWERLLNDANVRKVSFRQYQLESLNGEGGRRLAIETAKK
jgi:hypothetical protein